MYRERKQTREATPQMLRAMIDQASINVEERTLEVTFATDTPVRMYSWDDVYVNEVLSFENGHVRWDRINSGAPVLDNHQRYGSIADTQIGVVEKAWAEGSKGRAKIRFAKDDKAELIWQRVQDKIIRNISVGYNVFSYVKTEREGQLPEYRAIDWEPNEISFVPVPADYKSGVRNESDAPKHQVTIFSPNTNQRAMTIEQKRAEVARLKGLATRSADEEQQLRQLEADIATHERQATPPAPANPAPAAAPTVDVAAERAAAASAERQRASQIMTAVRAARLGESFAQELIDAGHSVDKARELIIAKFAEGDGDQKPKPGNRAAVTADGTDKRRAAMSDALLLRAGQHVEKPAEGARDFRGMSLLRMAEDALIAEGIGVRGMSAREIAETALNVGSRGYHSTSDFPIILGNTVNRVLRSAYELQPRTFMPFTRRTTARDFREMTKAQISGLVDKFDKVVEGGEYKYATLTEAKEAYKVEKFGRMIAITWETLINDDLDAFSRVPAAIAAKAAQKQSDIVWGIITGNPKMADNEDLFSVAHGNLAGTATAIDETGLSAARKAMRTQKSIEGDFINVQPRYMLVGPDKETQAQKVLQATIVATKTADTNVFRGFTDLIVEPRLTGNQWYLAADPSAIDTIEYAFLEGEGELFTEQRTGFDIDGLEIKARMVFGAKAIDWRGLYKNAGA